MGEKELKKLVIFLGIVVLIAVLGSAGVLLYLVGRNNDPLPDGHDILVYHVDNTYSDLNDRYCKARKLTITDEKRRLEYSDLKDVANLDGVLEIYYLDDMKANRLMKMYDMDPRITVSVPEALIRQFKDQVGSRGWFELKEGSAPRDHAKEIVLPETWLPSGKQVGDLIDYSGEFYVLSGINGAEAAWVSYTDGENSIFERYDPETYPEFERAYKKYLATIQGVSFPEFMLVIDETKELQLIDELMVTYPAANYYSSEYARVWAASWNLDLTKKIMIGDAVFLGIYAVLAIVLLLIGKEEKKE